MTRKGLIGMAILVFLVAITAVNAITLTLTSKNETAIQTLLLNGKTASAISAKKTAGLAQEIETLQIAYHLQAQASAAAATRAAEQAKAAAAKGTKELPVLLKQIETAISNEDARSINTAVAEAVASVEQHFAKHPVSRG